MLLLMIIFVEVIADIFRRTVPDVWLVAFLMAMLHCSMPVDFHCRYT